MESLLKSLRFERLNFIPVLEVDFLFEGEDKNMMLASSADFNSTSKHTSSMSETFRNHLSVNKTPKPSRYEHFHQVTANVTPTTISDFSNDPSKEDYSLIQETPQTIQKLVEEKPRFKVPGPSDCMIDGELVKAYSMNRYPTQTSTRALEIFTTDWPFLRSIGWRSEWWNAKIGSTNHEVVIIPNLKNITKGNKKFYNFIENIEFFVTRESFVEHLILNPVLRLDWEAFWSRLQYAGWTFEGSDFLCPSIGTLQGEIIDGRHVINGGRNLSLYIARFPFLLQDNITFSHTLKTLGWTKNQHGGYFWPFDEKCDHNLTLNDLKIMLWHYPATLFHFVASLELITRLDQVVFKVSPKLPVTVKEQGMPSKNVGRKRVAEVSPI